MFGRMVVFEVCFVIFFFFLSEWKGMEWPAHEKVQHGMNKQERVGGNLSGQGEAAIGAAATQSFVAP